MPATYTYDPTTLASSAVARVRRVVGDVGVEGVVSSATCRFANEEIAYAITAAGDNETDAAIELLEQLSTLYAGQANVSAGSQKIELGKLSEMYAARAERLRHTSTGGAIVDVPTTRIDGYSDDIASDDTDATNAANTDYPWWDV